MKSGYNLRVMIDPHLIATRIAGYVTGNPWEVSGFVTGLASVALLVRQNVWTWPIGIVNSLCWMVMFWQSRLYQDVGLNGFFVVISIYGWWAWLHPGAGKVELPVTRVPAWAWAVGVAVFASGTWMMGRFFSHTDAAFPWLDSATAVASVVAQWWMTRKWIENWGVWLAADVVMIGMYIAQNLWLTALVYVLFMILCVAGIRDWRRAPVPVPQP